MGLDVDTTNPNVLLATGEHAIYRSLDYGEKWLGARWECLTEDLPPSQDHFFALSAGPPCRLYGLLDGTVYNSAGDGRWRRGGYAGIPEYGQPLSYIAIDESDPDLAYAAVRVSYERFTFNIIFRSEDAGASWNNQLPRLYARYIARYERGGNVLEGELQGELYGLAVMGQEQLLAATSSGIMRSEDGGESWHPSNAGLGIPVARSVFCPKGTPTAYAGTPGGLYRSDDGGRTWRNANLVLIFRGNIPREVGSAGYLDAYWLGRYHGFISDEQATEDPSGWNMNI
jgi:hypothetical protein